MKQCKRPPTWDWAPTEFWMAERLKEPVVV